jgi:hypothetical protein
MFITVALTSLAHRITALPVARLVVWCLFLRTLMVSCGILALLADELERSVARKIAPETPICRAAESSAAGANAAFIPVVTRRIPHSA